MASAKAGKSGTQYASLRDFTRKSGVRTIISRSLNDPIPDLLAERETCFKV
jgi:hypothetical protein